MLVNSVLTAQHAPLLRSTSGKVPTILVYSSQGEAFDMLARTFAAADSLCSLFPVENQGQFEQALAHARAFDAIMLAHEAIDLPVADALARANAAQPSAALFLLTGEVPVETLPPSVLGLGADPISDANLVALPFIVDNIMRERSTTTLVQRALTEHEQLFQLLVEHIDDALWVCNGKVDQILYLSPAFRRIWGVDERELYENPQHWLNYIHPGDRRRYYTEFERSAMQGKAFTLEYRVERPDGKVRVVRDQGYPIFDAGGRLHRIGGVMRDITEDRRIQQELRLAHRLEAVGQLAAGIAHEINTPAQFIGDNLRFLQDGVGVLLALVERLRTLAPVDAVDAACADADLEFLREDLPLAIEQSLDGVQRVASIVRAMKEFSHPGSALPEPVDLNETIRSAVTVSRNEWKYVAELEQVLDPLLPPVTCHRQAISQVLVNLIVNAAHAIEQRGATDARRRIEVTSRVEGEYALVGIRDEGIGIPEENMGKIFDQFFTTKEVGKGTGQGLAMAWRTVVEGHGGRIEVESEPGVGTLFTLCLPLRGVASVEGSPP